MLPRPLVVSVFLSEGWGASDQRRKLAWLRNIDEVNYSQVEKQQPTFKKKKQPSPRVLICPCRGEGERGQIQGPSRWRAWICWWGEGIISNEMVDCPFCLAAAFAVDGASSAAWS